MAGITAFQIEQTAPAVLRLRLRFGPGADPDRAWRETEQELRVLLEQKGAGHVELERAEEAPLAGAGGKLRKVIPLA